uniref:CNH domain-containing protein n=1 Tax=Parascaris equorum TaxID=6256 RepID=A0A914R584_PAREQ
MLRYETRLLAPYKSLGEVCSSVPPAFRVLPTQRRITSVLCAIENVVVQYSAEHLRLVSTSFTMVSEKVLLMVPFGEVIVVVDANSSLHVLDIEDGSRVLQIDSAGEFTISAIIHPATYLNKFAYFILLIVLSSQTIV